MPAIKTYATHFCGVGGACWGLEQAGLKCKMAIDFLDYAVEYRERNLGHRALLMDIAEYEPSPGDAADLLWTSPPCQTYSTARERAFENKDDRRNYLFLNSVRYASALKPMFVVLENVTGVMTHESDGHGGWTLASMKHAFEEIGYHVEINVLNSLYYGLPQDRERVFLVASLDGEEGLIPIEPRMRDRPRFGSIMEPCSVDHAWGDETYRTALNKVGKLVKLHGEFKITVVGPDDVLPTVTCGWGGGATRKKIAIIDKTRDGLAFLRHPTLREGIRAQGFPEGWQWPDSESEAWVLVGNAVSSPVAKALAEHLKLVAAGKSPPAKRKLCGKRIPEYVENCGAEMMIPEIFKVEE